MSGQNPMDVAVVGGGVTGLTLAHLLDHQGMAVRVYEAQPHPGGAMRTSRAEGFLIEQGPNSAQDTTPLLHQLFAGLGIADQVEYASPAAKNRYVVRDGKLHAMPLGPPALLGTRLFSGWAKLRLLGEPFVRRSDPDQDEDLAHFVERRLGREFLDYAIDPFVSGVFAGLPEKLSVRSAFPRLWELEQRYGSLIKGAILGARERRKRQEQSKQSAQSFSFKEGLQTLIDALTRALGDKVHTGVPLRALRKTPEGFALEVADHPEAVRARAVVLTIPAHGYEQLEFSFDWAAARQALAQIYYPPVAVVFCGYYRNPLDRPLEGFGFLVPRRENRQILGSLWNSSLFSGRAPEGGLALTVFVGGSRQPEHALWPEEKLAAVVAGELKDLLSLPPPDHLALFRWPRAIPQYQVGHQRLIAAVEACEQQHPGLYLGGNFRGGISVADCVKSAYALADRVAGGLRAGGEPLAG
ncbi:MAG: protoporphyrinogen oxidase [Candidatus Latescibacteria bacterium]|nr:protoporphyrinogen oxidase [Candidatus Latescibacterota bacterium]